MDTSNRGVREPVDDPRSGRLDNDRCAPIRVASLILLGALVLILGTPAADSKDFTVSAIAATSGAVFLFMESFTI